MSMNYMISMGEGGSINPDRVIMVASLASQPVKQFLKNTPPDKLLNLTYGYPRRSIVVFDNGFVAITRYPVEQLDFAIRTKTEVEYDGLPF